MISIYLRLIGHNYDDSDEFYSFVLVKSLHPEELIKVVDKIKKDKNYLNLFVKDIRVLGEVPKVGVKGK